MESKAVKVCQNLKTESHGLVSCDTFGGIDSIDYFGVLSSKNLRFYSESGLIGSFVIL